LRRRGASACVASAPSRWTAAAIAGDQGLPHERRMQFLQRPEAENIGHGAKSMPSFIARALSATVSAASGNSTQST
jgi:hypothetical protein